MSEPVGSPAPRRIVVMGVCGTGKSTVGLQLAAALGCDYVDADDHHPAANVAKMRSGTPLTDADRAPWLDRLRDLLADYAARGVGVVLACSALKAAYRTRLNPPAETLHWVYLHGDRDLLAQRLGARAGHYMPSTLLDSQLATLEAPSRDEAVWCDVAESPAAITARLLKQFN